MTVKNRLKTLKTGFSENIFSDYYWFVENFETVIDGLNKDFFRSKIELRFMGLAEENNLLFYGDEYFVNKVRVNKNLSVLVRVSKDAIGVLLDETLGKSKKTFALEDLTELETRIMTTYCDYIYKKVSPALLKVDKDQKTFISCPDCHLNFYLRINGKHAGKIIITLPGYLIPKIPERNNEEKFSVSDFADTIVTTTIAVGRSKITLEDLKNMERGDILVLEKSNINRLAVIYKGGIKPFRVNPDPAMIVSLDNNGGKIMEDNKNPKNNNMWDSILVDIVAVLDEIKLPLGELKQISEGLVIDIGSVYDNKVNLKVEDQIVASGELVIINDRYGVKINEVRKEPSSSLAAAQPSSDTEGGEDGEQPQEGGEENSPKEGDEDFDYSYFEVEDESI
ncbi:FliM/FliN family flagellar motor switch protein [bacterium]|nr:FliM/FliN family flagellar motor switch protein [bacterium]